MCDLDALGASSIFGLVRRTGTLTGGLLTFASVSGIQFAQHNRGICYHFVNTVFPSRLEAMVGDTLARVPALHVGLGVGDYHRVWIACSNIAFVDFSFVELAFFFRCF